MQRKGTVAWIQICHLDMWIRCPNKMMHIRSGRLWRLSLSSSSSLLGGGRLRAIHVGLQWEINECDYLGFQRTWPWEIILRMLVEGVSAGVAHPNSGITLRAPLDDSQWSTDRRQQQQAVQSKGEVKVGTSGGTSNPWKATVNSQDLHQVEGSLTTGGFSMGGQGLGDRQDQTIGGRHKASEIKTKHATGASPREGTRTLGRQQ